MTKTPIVHPSDLRGYARLVTQATIGLTDLVEATHDRIARPPVVSAPDPKGRTRGITGFVYKTGASARTKLVLIEGA